MQIVVLDGYTLNPGDLSWDGLRALGDCRVFDRTLADDLLARAKGASVLLTNKTRLSRDSINGLAGLEYIGVLATGYDVVDIQAARERDIPVTNIPTYGTASVAQMVFAHVLNFTQHVAAHAQSVRDGQWAASDDWCYWNEPLTELAGSTMGIVGLGRIGRSTARLADAFGMQVLAYDRFVNEAPDYVQLVDLEILFRESDVISLHCPLTSDTSQLVNVARLGWMKETALLINTSRGQLIDEHALAAALNQRRIGGAGLDVLAMEPPEADNPLLRARNCQITPHIAWATRAARARLMQTAIANVAAFLAGRPQNVVNECGILPP